jgi:hypothetical protein
MTTRNGKLTLVATLAAAFACAAALASSPHAAAPGRSPAAAPAGTIPAAAPAATCSEPPPAPVPARRPHREPEGCTETPAPPHLRSKVFHQLAYHAHFPAPARDLLATFRATAELDPAELAWVGDRLPAAGVLPSAAAALSRLFPDAPAHLLARLAAAPFATVAAR